MLEEEKKLIREAQAGEAESFGKVYDHYIKPIYRFVFLKVSNKTTAEDLTHEVFLSAWQNLNSYHFQGPPFSSWLYQIARNKVIDHYRTKREFINLDSLEEKITKLAGDVEKNLDQKLVLEKIKRSLKQLSEEQQDVIIMRFINDLTPAEIAAAISKSEGAVRLIQHRAIANLKKITNEQI